MSRRKLSRRQAIRSGLSAAGLAAVMGSSPRVAAGATSRPAEVRNVIFMVADGMGPGVPSMAEAFSRRARGTGTCWHELQRHPETTLGFFETHSLNSLVTDSSAASTAWGSGSRVINGAVNRLPDGTGLTPIGPLVKDTGRRVGLVTTTTITHATPAGFAAVEKNRGSEAEIADQYLDTVDVLMGGGIEHFEASRRKDEKDLIAAYKTKGYVHWDHRRQVTAGQRPAKILGLFGYGHLPYTIDHRHEEKTAEQVPTLAEMTRAALGALTASPNGFLLQIEGGRVDHAAHGNDAAAMLWDQLAFDDAICVVREYVAEHPDTLVVITTDHGNASPGLRGMGGGYADTNKCFELLANFKVSFHKVQHELRQAAKDSGPSRDTAMGVIQSLCGIELAADQADVVAAIMTGKLPFEANRQHANPHGLLGQVLGNHTGVAFNGTNHTEDLAPVLAFGAGRTGFAGLLRNTDAFGLMTCAFDIRHRNPSMTEAQARRYAPSADTPDEVHWV